MATPRSKVLPISDLAQKIQSDVARVGIKATLKPMDQVNLRTEYHRR